MRALARDLAEALGSVGHLSRLRRTRSGTFSLAGAADGTDSRTWRDALLPLSAAVRDFCQCRLSAQGAIEVGHGRPVLREHVESVWPDAGSEPVALFDESGALRALGRAEGDRIVVIRGMVTRAI